MHQMANALLQGGMKKVEIGSALLQFSRSEVEGPACCYPKNLKVLQKLEFVYLL